jgi:hypothetical protein
MKKYGKPLLAVVLVVLIAAVVGYSLTFVNFHRTVSVQGEITRDGKPLPWESDNRVLYVAFVPEDRDADSNLYHAQTDPINNTFHVPALPTGTYYVSIQMNDPTPLADLLQFAYPLHNKDLKFVVKEDNQHIPIDLPAVLPQGSRPGMPAGIGGAGGQDGAPKTKRGKKKDSESAPTDEKNK